MSTKVPQALIEGAFNLIHKQERSLGDLLRAAKAKQREAAEAAQEARELMEQHDRATRQKEEVRVWLIEHAADQMEQA